MFNLDAFAARLKGIRIDLCLSQEALAHKLGISRVALSYYENGQRTPDIAFLQALHEATGYPLEYLMGMSEARETENIDLSAALGLTDEAITWIKENAVFFNLVVEAAPSELEQMIMAAAFYAAENGVYSSDTSLGYAALYRMLWENGTHDLIDLCKLKGYESIPQESRAHIRELIRIWQNRTDDSSEFKASIKTLSLLPTAADAVSAMNNRITGLSSMREKNALMEELQWLDNVYRQSQSNKE